MDWHFRLAALREPPRRVEAGAAVATDQEQSQELDPELDTRTKAQIPAVAISSGFVRRNPWIRWRRQHPPDREPTAMLATSLSSPRLFPPETEPVWFLRTLVTY